MLKIASRDPKILLCALKEEKKNKNTDGSNNFEKGKKNHKRNYLKKKNSCL